MSRRIYPVACVEAAQQAFKDLCTVQAHSEKDGDLLTVETLGDAPPETIDEFLNYALDAALDLTLVPDRR